MDEIRTGHLWKRRPRRPRSLRGDTSGSMDLKEFVVFAMIIFFGLILGGWITEAFGISGGDMVSQLLAFMIPVLAVYVLWKKVGVNLAK